MIVANIRERLVADDMAGKATLDEFVGVGRANLPRLLAIHLSLGEVCGRFIAAPRAARTVDGVQIEPPVISARRVVTRFT